MTFSHTNGPWSARANGAEWVVDAGRKQRVATVNTALMGQEANARLIAAAPELYAIALIVAAMPIADTTADDVPLYGLDGVYVTHGHVRAARAAVAKVEGAA